MQGLHRCHAVAHHVWELLGIIAMRIHAGIGAIGDIDPDRNGFAKTIALHLRSVQIFLQRFRAPTLLAADGIDVIPVVDVHHQPGAVLFGQSNTFVINQRSMFDRTCPAPDGVLNALGTVRMAGHVVAAGESGFHRGAHFGFTVFGLIDVGTVGEYRAGDNHLDPIRTLIEHMPGL